MSEPITLYDAFGERVTVYAPRWAEQEVEAGRLFSEPPASDNRPGPTSLTVEETLEKVDAGALDAADVLAAELVGKNRKTLVEALEARVKDS